MRTLLTCAALSAFVFATPGCLIVVDHDAESHWCDDDCTPRRALGIYTSRPDAATASQLNLDRDRVAVIDRVVTGSPADAAGLKQYDIITKIDSADASPALVRSAIRSHKAGEDIHVMVLREGKPVEITAKLR